MKKFYLKNDDGQIGPFSPEELKEQGITPETAIWYEGLEQWSTAGELDELKDIFTPPAGPAPEPVPVEALVPAAVENLPAEVTAATETAAAAVSAPIVESATAAAMAPPPAMPARKKGNPVISWVLSLAVLGGTGYYVYQDLEKNKAASGNNPETEMTISDTDTKPGMNEETVTTDPGTNPSGQPAASDTVTTPVTEEKKETVAPTATVPVTDAKQADADKKKQLAADAKKKEEEKKKLLAAQQAAKEMEMRNNWQKYVTIGPYKIEGDDKVKPFVIPVYNAFPVAVDKVTLRVDYLKKEKVVASETLTLGSIPSRGGQQAQAMGNKKGKTANVYITGVSSRQMHFCFPSTGGKAGDPNYCN